MILFPLLCLLSTGSFCGDPLPEDPACENKWLQEQETRWNTQLRSRTLSKLDKMLSWTFPWKYRSYCDTVCKGGITFENDVPALVAFSRYYGYFSPVHPIIATVTEDKADVLVASDLFRVIYEYCCEKEFLQLATAETLTKILAYRELEKGDVVSLPYCSDEGSISLEEYTVDRVFDLGKGMPAFGFVPKNRGKVHPLLLYRGTDLSLQTKQGWASVLSDLDVSGPGLSAFQSARQRIHLWLDQVHSFGKKTAVMGFSLGGVLSMSTMIYEFERICAERSYVFNPPGVSNAVWEDWELIPEGQRPKFHLFLTQGDIIPKMGNLLPNIYLISLDRQLKPLAAHTLFIAGQPLIYQAEIEVKR